MQSAVCAAFVSCFDGVFGDNATVDSAYGPQGTCWAATQAVASSCNEACASSLNDLASEYPDAGCTPVDAGVMTQTCTSDGGLPQAHTCAVYVACLVAIGIDTPDVQCAYGPGGRCWTTTQAVADACTSACMSGVDALQSAYPDAGAACEL
jgi:hypothetical protein